MKVVSSTFDAYSFEKMNSLIFGFHIKPALHSTSIVKSTSQTSQDIFKKYQNKNQDRQNKGQK